MLPGVYSALRLQCCVLLYTQAQCGLLSSFQGSSFPAGCTVYSVLGAGVALYLDCFAVYSLGEIVLVLV